MRTHETQYGLKTKDHPAILRIIPPHPMRSQPSRLTTTLAT